MIKVIDTTDEYGVYSQNGLKSGETVYVKEDDSVHFLTNNINGVTETINAYTSAEENVQSDWAQTDTEADDYIKNKPNLSTVATSGDYTDLSNTPSLSTVATSGDYTDLLNKPSLSTVATSGDYTDLSNKPTIPTNTSDLTNDSGFVTSTTTGLKIEVVTEMPASPADDTIYFVKNNS